MNSRIEKGNSRESGKAETETLRSSREREREGVSIRGLTVPSFAGAKAVSVLVYGPI